MREGENNQEIWRRHCRAVYDEVERRFPVAKAKNVWVKPKCAGKCKDPDCRCGQPVNMDREAMMARLHGVLGVEK